MKVEKDFNPLSLNNQLCFALYVCSKEVIKKYTPLLEPLGLTYTSYIALLCLWENDNISVKEMGEKLFLDSGTLTPLLKKMEAQNLITRTRSKEDERTVYIKLTQEGKDMRNNCINIPEKLACSNMIDLEKAGELIKNLHQMMAAIKPSK